MIYIGSEKERKRAEGMLQVCGDLIDLDTSILSLKILKHVSVFSLYRTLWMCLYMYNAILLIKTCWNEDTPINRTAFAALNVMCLLPQVNNTAWTPDHYQDIALDWRGSTILMFKPEHIVEEFDDWQANLVIHTIIVYVICIIWL